MKTMEGSSTALLRITDILGDKDQGIRPLIPVSRTTWYSGIKRGMYPKPVKLGDRVSAWRSQDIQKLIEHGPHGGEV
jgi:prophage regulatory protein